MAGSAQKTSNEPLLNYGPILAAMPRPAAVLDTRGEVPTFMGFSTSFLAELGLKAAAVQGRPLRDVFPPDTSLLISDAIRRCQKERQGCSRIGHLSKWEERAAAGRRSQPHRRAVGRADPADHGARAARYVLQGKAHPA